MKMLLRNTDFITSDINITLFFIIIIHIIKSLLSVKHELINRK